jgi:hypothetical protein
MRRANGVVSPGSAQRTWTARTGDWRTRTAGHPRLPALAVRRAEGRLADAGSGRGPGTSACGIPGTPRRSPSPEPGTSPGPRPARRCPPRPQRTAAKAHQWPVMCTPVILADRYPPSTHATPTSTCHVIIARAELRKRPQLTFSQAIRRPTRRVVAHGEMPPAAGPPDAFRTPWDRADGGISVVPGSAATGVVREMGGDAS